MEFNTEPIKNWFGFTRRERRSSFVLLIIIMLIIGIRYIVPESKITIEDITAGVSGIENLSGFPEMDISSDAQLFSFDPNTASYDTLIKLGLAVAEANTLIKYRTRGGKFRYPSDIKKVYGIDEERATRLISYVEVASDTSVKPRTNSFFQKKPLLDINNCDSISLDRLPGIGPVLSARIIKYRHFLGGFARIDQLREVYGLSPETFDLIKGRVYADSSVVRRTGINTADYKELSHLPYLEKSEVTAILKYRELKGRIYGTGDLIENKLITEEKANKVMPYMKFD